MSPAGDVVGPAVDVASPAVDVVGPAVDVFSDARTATLALECESADGMLP